MCTMIKGADDTPAHIKFSLIGRSLLLPVGHGTLLFGTWENIWLGESS